MRSGADRALGAVLFDMDGTLLDSEKIWTIGLEELARHYSGELSSEARWSMVGTSMLASMEILHADIGQPWRRAEESTVWLETRVKQLYSEGVAWRPGAQRLLAAARAAGVPTALVTATRRHIVDVAVGAMGAHPFDVVVAGDEVAEVKPAPDPYLAAARMLGVEPQRCVVVEDSPSGVASGVAAGCPVLAVPCEVEIEPAEGVTLVDSLVRVDLAYLEAMVSR